MCRRGTAARGGFGSSHIHRAPSVVSTLDMEASAILRVLTRCRSGPGELSIVRWCSNAVRQRRAVLPPATGGGRTGGRVLLRA